MSETTLLYVLSTLAQTCAALAAFVGAVGVFRLQVLRERRKEAERNLRTLSQRLRGIEQARGERAADDPDRVAVRDADTYWQALGSSIRHDRRALLLLELWNLAVIGAALIGFNHLPALTSAGWTSRALWAVAVGTVLVTLYCVIVWTRRVEE